VLRQLRIGVVTTVVIALLGLPAGPVWRLISPREHYVKYGGVAIPDGSTPIGIDGRFAVIGLVLGLACAVVAYLLAGRLTELPLAVGLAAGGVLGSLIAWQLGNWPGRSTFEHAAHRAADGTALTGPPDVQAHGVLLVWPLVAVVVFGLLDAADVAKRAPRPREEEPQEEEPLAAGDVGEDGAGEGDEVGGRELDLQAAPPRRDVDGGQS
jgi:hypothetical protein